MEKERVITRMINKDPNAVWETVKKPSHLALHGDVNVTVVSDLEWIEHTSPEVDNKCTATVDEVSRTVTVKSVNSKYSSESDSIKISVSDEDKNCRVTIDYTMHTGAVANILVMKFAGDKIVESSVDKMIKHIEQHC